MTPRPSQAKAQRTRRHRHPKPSPKTTEEVARALELLRATLRRRGLSQLQVQRSLGWGRTYISQLLSRQKSLRFDQILQILHAAGREPGDFFAELYGWESLGSIEKQVRCELEVLLQRVFLGFFETFETWEDRAPGPTHARRLARSFLTHLERSAVSPRGLLGSEEGR